MFLRLCVASLGAWFTFFVLVPNILLLAASVAHRDPDRFIRPGWTLEHYRGLFDPALASMFGHSLFLAGGATLLCLLVAYPFAAILVQAGRKAGRRMLLLVMIPFWTNSLIRTYALMALLKADGPLNKLLLAIGIIDQPLRLMYTPLAVFIGLTYMLLPFMVLPLYTALEGLDKTLFDAARDLGASPWRRFRTVTLPLTMPGVVSGCMMVFLPALGMFYVPDMLGGAKGMLLGNYIRDQFLTARNWPMGSAASLAMTAAMGVMLLVYYRSLRRSGQGAAL